MLVSGAVLREGTVLVRGELNTASEVTETGIRLDDLLCRLSTCTNWVPPRVTCSLSKTVTSSTQYARVLHSAHSQQSLVYGTRDGDLCFEYVVAPVITQHT
jgi:hypothetical protein